MNEREFEGGLRDVYTARASYPDAEQLCQRVLATPIENAPQRRVLLPPIDRRFLTMFSATKYIVAGAIVALFGGLLVRELPAQPTSEQRPGAVASASASPTVSPDATTAVVEPSIHADDPSAADLLPGVDLITEEVEPGVFRVVSDGHREQARSVDRSGFELQEGPGNGPAIGYFIDRTTPLFAGRIVAGLDGSVWTLGPGGIYRLGEPTVHPWSGGELPHDIEVDPHGVLWGLVRDPSGGAAPMDVAPGLVSFDAGDWTLERSSAGSVFGLEMRDDGTVWAAWTDGRGRIRAGSLRGGEWTLIGDQLVESDFADPDGHDFAVDPRSPVVRPWIAIEGAEQPQRILGTEWRPVPVPDAVARLDVGRDGTVWVRLYDGCASNCGGGPSTTLARFEGGEWRPFDKWDGLPTIGPTIGFFTASDLFEVAPDGSLWFSPQAAESEPRSDRCDGLANFDGLTYKHVLQDHCVYGMDIAPDGAVWLLASPTSSFTDDEVVVDTFVVLPEMVPPTAIGD